MLLEKDSVAWNMNILISDIFVNKNTEKEYLLNIHRSWGTINLVF